jgi:hypothetical protein
MVRILSLYIQILAPSQVMPTRRGDFLYLQQKQAEPEN